MEERGADKKPSSKYQYVAAALANVVSFSSGNAVGWLSPSLSNLKSGYFLLDEPLTTSDISLVASLYCVGVIIGIVLFKFILNKWGGRVSALACSVPLMMCWILKIWWHSTTTVMLARVFAGIGSGGAILAPVKYCSELDSIFNTGSITLINPITFNVGILFAYIIGAVTRFDVFMWILLMMPVLFFIVFAWMPESPVFLIKKGKEEEGVAVIAWLKNVSPYNSSVRDIFSGLKGNHLYINVKRQNYTSLKDKLFSASVIKPFVICFVLFTLKGYIGVLAIISYASEIFEGVGGSISPNVSTIVIGTIQLVGSCASSYFIHRFGRKTLLMISSIVVSSGFIGVGTYFYLKSKSYDLTSFQWTPVVFLSIILLTYSIGVDSVSFVIISEIFTDQVKGIISSILMVWSWVVSFIVLYFYSSAISTFGIHCIFWSFGTIAITQFLFTLIFVPETKGKQISEITKKFVYCRKNENTNETSFALI